MPTDLDAHLPQYAVDDPTPYRRSLRASQARREAVRRRIRLHTRGRRSLAGVVLAMSLMTGGALADTTAPPTLATSAPSSITAAQAKLGVTADGVVGPLTRRAVKAFQQQQHLTADGILGPQTLAALGVTGSATTGATVRSASSAKAAVVSGDPTNLLESIALCESGGDPRQVSGSGQYRGKYQFDRQTWRSVGGKGDPAAAPAAEQDQRAQMLLQQRGPSVWPVCSKKVGAG